jgi:hypothetical protein
MSRSSNTRLWFCTNGSSPDTDSSRTVRLYQAQCYGTDLADLESLMVHPHRIVERTVILFREAEEQT